MLRDEPRDWRPNANEAPVMADFNMGVAQVGMVGGVGWKGIRAVARRLGLPVAEPVAAAVGVGLACPRCGVPLFAGEAACAGCGRAAPPARLTTAADIATFTAEAERRWRRDLALAVLMALVLGVGLLLLALTMERGYVQTLAVRLWWLAGLFWGVLFYVGRRWLDQ